MSRKISLVALACAVFFVASLVTAVEKRYPVAPPRPEEKISRFVRHIELLPGVQLPAPRAEKALSCTLALFGYDGAPEQEWTAGFVPYEWHCDDFRPYSGSACWWNGDPLIGGYQDIWKERLDTKTVTATNDTVVLSFWQWMRCEPPNWDGGNVWMSVDGGSFQVIFPEILPYDSLLRAWEAHGDTATWGWGREDTIWRYTEFREYVGSGNQVTFRFEFASDWYSNTADDTSWFGWLIDEITTVSGSDILVESDCEDPDTAMFTSVVEPPSAFEKSNAFSVSPDSSWRARDDFIAINCALTSPWIYIPDYACGDSIRDVELEFSVHEYVPGAAVGGYLEDFYSLEVVTNRTSTGWPAFPLGDDTLHLAGYWQEMFHDYDHEFDYGCPSDTCDCLENWLVQDRRRIYNGYATLDPAIADSVKLRFRWQTDSTITGTAVWCDLNGAQRGMFVDNFIVTGGPGATQDVGPIYNNETNRPITAGVEVGTEYTVKCHVRNEGFQTTANPATIYFQVMTIDTGVKDDTNYYDIGNCGVAAGLAPNAEEICSILWTPTTDHMGDYVERLIIRADMTGDVNSENDTLSPLGDAYYVNVTPDSFVMLGYDVWRSFYGSTTDSASGYAVRFEPHTFPAFDLYRVTFQAAYGGLYRLHVFDKGSNDSTPGAERYVGDPDTSVERLDGWTVVDLDDPSLQGMNDEFWVWIEELGNPPGGGGDTCGMSMDEASIDGGHSYTGNPTDGFEKESPRDYLLRAYIREGEAYQCGDCNGDGRVTIADATYLVAFIYRGGPAPVGESDVNDDGRTTIADATYLVAFIYRGGPPPCQPGVGLH